MKEVLVIHHANCDDGFGAAWVANKYFKDKPDYNVTYYPATHGERPPDTTGKEVYILDFSYPPDVIRKMESKAELLVLQDHHKSAREAYLSFEDNSMSEWSAHVGNNGVVNFDMNRSGAMLAWNYFFPSETPPVLIDYIQDNDLWKFKLAFTKDFIRALRSYPQTFEAWDKIASLNDWRRLEFVKEGEAIERFFNQQCQFMLDNTPPVQVRLGKEVGLGICAPKTFASELGHILAIKSGTFGLVWTVDGNKVICSLRSNKGYDVSKLAAEYGGGGHGQAAGCRIDLFRFVTAVWHYE